MLKRACAILSACTILLVGAGCVETTVVSGPGSRVRNGGGGGGGAAGQGFGGGDSFAGLDDFVMIAPSAGNDPSLDWSDPCANNLVAVSGELLMYYSQHHGLPATLAELPPSPDGEQVSLVCPESGKAYVYYPQGYGAPLEMIGAGWSNVSLVLYDAVPSHKMTQHLTDGTKSWDKVKIVRFGIIIDPPGRNGAVQLHVVPIEDQLLAMFLKPKQVFTRPLGG